MMKKMIKLNNFDLYYPTERDPLVVLRGVDTENIIVRSGGDDYDDDNQNNRFSLRCGFFSERFRGKLLLVVTGLLLFIVMFMNSPFITDSVGDNEAEAEVVDDGGERSFTTFSIMNLINFFH